jgi:hypothetical protein
VECIEGAEKVKTWLGGLQNLAQKLRPISAEYSVMSNNYVYSLLLGRKKTSIVSKMWCQVEAVKFKKLNENKFC